MSDVEYRAAPDVETRVQEVVRSFQASHREPLNLALHGLAALHAARGVYRFFSGRRLAGLFDAGVAALLVEAGHRIEADKTALDGPRRRFTL